MTTRHRFVLCLSWCIFVLRLTMGEYIVVEYFSSENCKEDFELYAVAVDKGVCIANYDTSTSAEVICSKSNGLQIVQYSHSMDCTGSSTIETVFAGSVVKNDKCVKNFAGNMYYGPGEGVTVDCSMPSDWENYHNYKVKRRTSTLSSSSAYTFFNDNCPANTADDAKYSYCFIDDTDNNQTCYPSASRLCADYTTKYYYKNNVCLNGQYNYENNKTMAILHTYEKGTNCTEYAVTGGLTYLPYKECLGCNEFRSTSPENNDDAEAPWILVVIVIAIIIGVLIICCAAVGALACCGVISMGALFICFRNEQRPMHGEAVTKSPLTSDPPVAVPITPQYES